MTSTDNLPQAVSYDDPRSLVRCRRWPVIARMLCVAQVVCCL